MSAEKVKGKGKEVTSGGKKGRQQASSSKPAMKQKTLFDSFGTRTSSRNAAPVESQPAVVAVVDTDIKTSETTDKPEDLAISQGIREQDRQPDIPTSTIEIMDDSHSPRTMVLESPVIETLTRQSLENIASSAITESIPNIERQRSPSLVLLESPQAGVPQSSRSPPILVDMVSPIVNPSARARSPSVVLMDPPASMLSTIQPTSRPASKGKSILHVSSGSPVVKPLVRERSPSLVLVDNPASTTLDIQWTSKSARNAEGKTPDQPILVESSPVKVTVPSTRPHKPVHPFFAPKQKPNAPLRSATMEPFRKVVATIAEHQGSPLPDRLSQHVRGMQTHVQNIAPCPFPKRLIHAEQHMNVTSDYQFLQGRSHTPEKSIHNEIRSTSPTTINKLTLEIPQEHQTNYPAISRLLHDNPGGSIVSRRPWAEKWRPFCASEVLGNETSAIYLRNWLRALELQFEEPGTGPPKETKSGAGRRNNGIPSQRGTKRMRVVRAVEKKRKKTRMGSDAEDDWIVRTDDESDEEIPYGELDEYGELLSEPPVSSPSSSQHANLSKMSSPIQPLEKEPDLGQLHNTILLVGPHGSGKTAAVYACAEELGWEVFEVYPGIGRRNGSNVDNLVGEVGKNHLVLQNRQPEDIMKSFVQSKNKLTALEPLTGSDYSPRKKSTLRAPSEFGDLGLVEVKPIRQSLILLEEVDILFKEDTNFWSTVTRIIKECKRPVVCTCNDMSLIPINDLPLQDILYFNPSPPSVAVSYLKTLCFAEGYDVSPDILRELYVTDSIPDSSLLQPFLPDKSQTPDLRQTINSLQVLCGTSKRSERLQVEADHILTMSVNIDGPNTTGIESSSSGHDRSQSHISVRGSEALSYLDCALEFESLHKFAAAEFADYSPTEDDEIGHAILHDRYVQDSTYYGLNDRLEDVLNHSVEVARVAFGVNLWNDSRSTDVFEERARRQEHEQRMILREICPIGVWDRRDASMRLDYIPFLRQIVEAEDMEEAKEMEKRPKGGRSTRNSARSGYVRMLELTGDSRVGLARTVLM